MSRLIDADALIDEIEKRRKAAKTLTGIDMVMLLKDAPTIGGLISVKDMPCMENGEIGTSDKSAVNCLKAVELINKYLNDEEQCCGCTYWTDKKGYSFKTDIGYFFEGLEAFENYLIKRLRKAKIDVKQDETD